MATLKDVAKEAGVSLSTASRVLSGLPSVNGEIKEKVLLAAKKLHYQPNDLAKSLRQGRTNTIALIIPNIQTAVFPPVTKGVEDVAKKYGYTVILSNTDEDIAQEISVIKKLQNRWVDGFILTTATEKSNHIPELRKKNIPLVQLIRYVDEGIDAIVSDNVQAGYKGTEYLLEYGHQKIAFLNSKMEIRLYRQRYEGFLRAMGDWGVEPNPCWVIHDIYESQRGYEVMKSILEGPDRPTAIFCARDAITIGALQAIREKGLSVPGDISVLGFDNYQSGPVLSPSVSTIVQSTYEMGVRAAERLIQIIQARGELTPQMEILDVTLIERDSVTFPKDFRIKNLKELRNKMR